MQPHRMSAAALLKACRSRALSPVEAMQDVLARVGVFEPHIHATYPLEPEPERALRVARASQERWFRGEPQGPLNGVPATVKDNIATKGEPVPLGPAASELKPAAADAPPVARLGEAGAILFTKTTMPIGMQTIGRRFDDIGVLRVAAAFEAMRSATARPGRLT
jgi:aspartyl-tRNA(Asn)/glutamyl-tRNA(Gln) amidotransferase subunit A